MRYSGWLGISSQEEISPGVWEDVLAFVPVLGSVKQTTEVLEGESDILPRNRTTTSISVKQLEVGQWDTADHRIITYKGRNFQINSIVDDPPNMTIFVGEEYHGPASG